ncbi:MAG: tyrosine-type recombinase/integrase [Cyclobacteriaceae bacterium]
MAPFFISEFFDYLRTEKRYSEHTLVSYEKDLLQFLEFSGIQNKSELGEVRSSVVRGWIVDLMEKDFTARSVNRKLSTLRTFFRFLMKEGVVDHNPLKTVKGPKTSKRLPSFAKTEHLEVSKMDNLFTNDFTGVRDRLMFEFLYQTGIRSSELVGLTDDSVKTDQIKVLGKRNKERIIPINPQLSHLVQEYLQLRNNMGLQTNNFFVLDNGKKLYPKFVYRKINSYLTKATDLEKRSPHVLRHTFATHMLNNGAGLEVLKDLLGHANLSATQVYTHNSFAQLNSIYSQSHPRGHKT